MTRAIITYRIITLNHVTIDEVEFTENQKTVSLRAPNYFNDKYKSYDDILSDDLTQFNKVIHNPTICYKSHLNDPNAKDNYQKQIKKCESEYYFAISGKFIIPKFNKMKIFYDCAGAFHEGYCSDEECELKLEESVINKIVDLPEKLLGLYEEKDDFDEIELPITKNLRKIYEFKIEKNNVGSGYCYIPDSDIEIFKNVNTCNTEYYFINRIILC